jgi:hypothetical protein
MGFCSVRERVNKKNVCSRHKLKKMLPFEDFPKRECENLRKMKRTHQTFVFVFSLSHSLIKTTEHTVLYSTDWYVNINTMTTHSPVAQIEVEAEIYDLKETIKGYENDYKQATGDDKKGLRQLIIAKEGRLLFLYEELKALRQQGNEQRTRLSPCCKYFILCN